MEARDGHLENFLFIGYKRNKHQNNLALCVLCFRLLHSKRYIHATFEISFECLNLCFGLYYQEIERIDVTQSVEGVVTLHVL